MSEAQPFTATQKTDEHPAPADDDDDDDEDLFGDGDDDEEEESPVEPFVGASALPSTVAAEAENQVSAAPPAAIREAVAEVESPSKSLAIPRKVHKAVDSTTPTLPSLAPIAPATPTHNGDPTPFGLPPGVRVPASITSALLNQGKLLETIKSLPANLINDALTEYDDAVQIKGSSIRNHGAYLYGVCKRYCSVHERAAAGEGSGILPMGEALTDTVNGRLEQLVHTHFCSREEMNDKVKSKIRMLSEKDAIFALDELGSVDRSSIRNFGSYFMGILNRYMRGDASSKIRPPAPAQASQKPPSPRGRDRSYRDSGPSYYVRDRSRDRFEDQQRGAPDFAQSGGGYDPRQRKPGWDRPPPWNRGDNSNRSAAPPAFSHQQPPSGPPPGLPNHSVGPYGPPQGRSYGSQPPFVPQQPPFGSNQQQPPPPPYRSNQPQQPPFGSNQPPHYAPNHQQPPPYAPNQQQPYGGNQAQQQPYGSSYPPQQPGMQQPINSVGGMYSQQQQPPNPSQPPYMANQQAPPFVQNQSQPPMMNPHQPQPPPYMNHQQAPPQHGSYHSGPGAAEWGAPPQQGGPVDILGLADKAASAVQALASQNRMNGNYGAPPGASFPPYGQAPQQPASFHPPQQEHGGRRRRTTATINELPVPVQYAVQNLVATGTVDGQLDDGMLGMIFDLPEPLALAALQKFAAIDKSTMRNKTAYLAGVLRRELERIKKR